MEQRVSDNGNLSTLRSLGRALAHRNYRLYFAGQGISLIGTWMTRMATGWLIFRINGSEAALLLGVVTFAGQIPAFFLAPIAGVLVDRWNRRRLLLVTQALAGIQSGMLAAVAFSGQSGTTTNVLIILLSLFQGFINAFDMPGRQAFFMEMVTRREDLPNAIALNSSLVNGARLIGPSIAGVLIALAGEGWCFLIDAVSYLAVIAALYAMDVTPRIRKGERQPVLRGLIEGIRYSFGFAPIRSLLLLLALMSFMGAPYSSFMPVFASDVLHGGPYELGFLTGASGIGALVGALYLASRRTVVGLGRIIVISAAAFGLGLVGFALSHELWLSLFLMLLVGGGMMVEMAASNTILQTIADEDKLGRVMSFYSMAFLGMTPLGSLAQGVLATAIGVPRTVLIGGIACVVGAFVFAIHLPRLRRIVRPMYASMGILPEVATGLQSAVETVQSPE
jgi:MFS family permease